jgi:hypothetical protein
VTVSAILFVPVASQQLALIATKAEGGPPLQVQIHFRFLAVTMATEGPGRHEGRQFLDIAREYNAD